MKLVIMRHGNILYISENGNNPAPRAVELLLHDHLVYDHRKFLYGFDAIDPVTGLKRTVEVTERRLYGRDDKKRIYTNFGFAPRIYQVLTSSGYSIEYRDLNKEREARLGHPRPDRYVPDISNVTYHFTFRQRQDKAIQRILQRPCGVVHAVTGFGKMVLMAMVCLLFPKAKIHIVTRRLPLVNKITEALTRYIPNVGQFGDGERRFGDRVTVFSSRSLHHSDFDADILLADEVHELMADDSVTFLSRYQQSRNYGFTATPKGRLDGTDIRLEALFGPTIFQLTYPEAVKLELVVPVEVRWSNVLLKKNPAAGLDKVEKKRYGIWFNDERNDIISKVISTIPQDEQFLTLTDTIYHAIELYKRVSALNRKRETVLVYDTMETKRFVRYKSDNVLPPGEDRMTSAKKEQLRARFEAGEIDVISTPTWEVGIDPTLLQHLCVASSFSSEIKAQQAPGRVSRITSKINKPRGFVYDMRDQFDTGFAANSRQRFKTYDSLEWEQTIVDGTTLTPFTG